MKRVISMVTAMAILVGIFTSFTIPSFAAETNLLTDGGFEINESMSTGNSWTFKNGQYPWYQYGGVTIVKDTAAEGTNAASFSKGVIGQRVSLVADKSYHLTAKIYTTAATTIKMGFHDGTKSYPNDNPVMREDKALGAVNEWDTIGLDFECTKSQEYVICFYNDKKVQMYIDNVTLTEIEKPEFGESEMERITIQDKRVTTEQLTYNVVVGNGTQGTLITTLYADGGEPRVVDTRASGTEIQTITIPLSDGEIRGRVEFSLVDSVDNTMSLSLPTVTEWDTTQQSSSQITLNFNTYPLYVGNSSTTNFTDWDGHGASIDLVAEVSGDYSKNDIVWTVSDKDIVSMTEDASDKSKILIKGCRTGYAMATASLPDGTSASCYIPVIDNYNRLQMQRIVLNTDTLNIAADATASLKAILYPKDVLLGNPVKVDTSIVWESSNDEIATVDENGTITAVSSGKAKITVTSNDVGRTAVCTVTVTDSIKATGIASTQTETVNITVGDTTQLTANVDGTSPIIWKSENSYVADVDENGLVTAYSNSNVQVVSDDGMDVSENTGTVKIYATTADGGYIAEYNICVSDAPIEVQSVSINKERINIQNGTTANLTAVVAPSKILQPDVEWSSSNESVVKVTPTDKTIFGASQAVITPVSGGSATITASYGNKTDTCIVTVTDSEIKISDIDLEAKKTIDIDEVYQFTPTITANATDDKLIWLDTDENIATIDREGNVMGYSEGTVTVYAIARDSLTADEVQTLEDLKYDVRTIGTDNATLNGILARAKYTTCTLTVQNPDGAIYLRNLHIPEETITDNSISLLWNRASLVFALNIDKYIIYQNGEKIAETEQMAYR